MAIRSFRALISSGTWTIKYLLSGSLKEIDEGRIEVLGKTEHGQALLRRIGEATRFAKTVWNRPRHNAGGVGGTHLLTAELGEAACSRSQSPSTQHWIAYRSQSEIVPTP